MTLVSLIFDLVFRSIVIAGLFTMASEPNPQLLRFLFFFCGAAVLIGTIFHVLRDHLKEDHRAS